MSATITIPLSGRTGSARHEDPGPAGASSPASSSSAGSSPSTSSAPTTPKAWTAHQGRRRPSLLSSSVSKAEHTSFELGTRDGSPRVITYVKASQGFDWNEDIFLPNSCDITVHNGLGKAETVHEIVLTDEDSFLPL